MSEKETCETGERTPESASGASEADSSVPEMELPSADPPERVDTVTTGAKKEAVSGAMDPETEPKEAHTRSDPTQYRSTPAIVEESTVGETGEGTPESASGAPDADSLVREAERPSAKRVEGPETEDEGAKEEAVPVGDDPETVPNEGDTPSDPIRHSSTPAVVEEPTKSETGERTPELASSPSEAVSTFLEAESPSARLVEGEEILGAESKNEAVSGSTDPEPGSSKANRYADPTENSSTATIMENPTKVLRPGVASAIPTGLATPGETVNKTVNLKNARVNEPYIGEVEVTGLRGVQIVDNGGVGLDFDSKTATLSGTPGKSGNFTLRFRGLLDGRRCDVSANLVVIPDPRSLWVPKDSDRLAPYWKEDEDHELLRGDLICVAASKRGRSHAQDGLFRDDDFSLWTGGPGGWSIAVVADGAGSAKFSRRGSRIAVRTIKKDLPKLLDEHLTDQIDVLISELKNEVEGAKARIRIQLYNALVTAAFNAAKAIGDEAKKVGERASAFSTTLVMVVARRVPHGWFIAGFAIGDGGAAIFDQPSRTVVPLTLADSGEFAGQTRFLQTSEFSDGDAIVKRIFFEVRDEFTAILAMTDGITDPKFPTDAEFKSQDNWIQFWDEDLSQGVNLNRDNPELEQELLAWLDFWSPGNHDDRTLAIMLP